MDKSKEKLSTLLIEKQFIGLSQYVNFFIYVEWTSAVANNLIRFIILDDVFLDPERNKEAYKFIVMTERLLSILKINIFFISDIF